MSNLVQKCQVDAKKSVKFDTPKNSGPVKQNKGDMQPVFRCNVAFLETTTRSGTIDWFLDSGASRHVTSSLENLSDFDFSDIGTVIFGDGKRSKIFGSGKLCVDGMQKLKGVCYVKGLCKNLLSVSQLCEDNMKVVFTRDRCTVYTEDGMKLITGSRTLDSCY